MYKPTRHHVGVLFHIADRTRWELSKVEGAYSASSRGKDFADEGFIHLSTAEQWGGVLDRFYVGATDLVLLHIEETLLSAPLVYEQLGDAAEEEFPHLYGLLNPDAVVHVDVLRPA